MIKTSVLKEKLKNGFYSDLLLDIYADESKIAYQADRYIKAIERYESLYGESEITIFSAPGRSETQIISMEKYWQHRLIWMPLQ